MTQFVVLAIGLLAAGALVGFLAGMFGVGGGTVVVPILYEVFVWFSVPDDLRMPLCAGTSLALIVPTSIASFTTHRKAASIDFALLRQWILPVIAGVLAGDATASERSDIAASVRTDGRICQPAAGQRS